MEELFKDVLDDDFVEIFRWQQYLQRILGFSRVEIRDRFVTPPRKAYVVYRFVLWIILLPISTLYFLLTSELIQDNERPATETYYVPHYYAVLVLIHIVLFYHNNLNKENLNCGLYIKLQKIDRHFGVDFSKNNKKLSLASKCFSCALALGFLYWTYVMLHLFIVHGYYVFTMILALTIPAFLFETIIFIYMQYYLIVRMEYIFKIVDDICKKQNDIEYFVKSIKVRDWLHTDGERRQQAQITDGIVRGLHGVLSSMLDMEDVYKHVICCSIATFLVTTHVILLIVIVHTKTNSLVWMIVGLALVVFYPFFLCGLLTLSLLGYKLSKLLKKTRQQCFAITTLYSLSLHDETLLNAKRMVILLNAKSPIISIYGLFQIDQYLPLRIFNIATTYSILYLQFTSLE